MDREVCEHYTPLSMRCDKCQLSPIDRLGLAISDAGITWTEEMRKAWDNAKDEYEVMMLKPMFTPRAIYNSKTHGFVEFKGMDRYMGQTTLHFRSHTYGDDCYWLPETLSRHFDVDVPNAGVTGA